MAVTYAQFDASKPIGGRYARGADYIRRGFDEMISANASAVGVTGGALDPGAANAVKDTLIHPDVGAADAANARLMYNAAYTVKYWTDALTAGGFFQALADLDKGRSG